MGYSFLCVFKLERVKKRMTHYDLLRHCAPTLANVKVGSLFTVKYDDLSVLQEKISEYNRFFLEKGVCVVLLRAKEQVGLIYVYRGNQLEKLLQNGDIQSFLQEYGYADLEVGAVLAELELQLQKQEFPHHIGVFLGYPLADIRGFIEHGGKNCHCTGVWKVYHDPESAIKKFHLYKKCVKIYLEQYAKGVDMNRLTVAG